MLFTILNLLRYFDFFGQSISLNFRGREKYQTKVGGLISLAIAVTMVVFMAGRLDKFFNKNDPIISEVT